MRSRAGTLVACLALAAAAACGGTEPSTAPVAPSTPAASPSANQSPNVSGAASSVAGRIAFVDRDGHVATVAADGSDQRTLGEQRGQALFPAWAPSGDRVAAASVRGNGGAIVVFEDVVPAGGAGNPSASAGPGSELYSSADDAPIYLYWSPDGDRIAFLMSARAGVALHIVDSARGSGGGGAGGSTEEAPVLETAPAIYWEWVQEGERILLHAHAVGAERPFLGFVDPDGGDRDPAIPDPGSFQTPGVSASGRYLAYALADERGKRGRVVVEDRQGEALHEVPHVGLAALGWAPSGDRLAFLTPSAERDTFVGPLRALDAATGRVRTIDEADVAAFFWAPDGTRLAYLALDRRDPGEVAGAPGVRLAAVSVAAEEEGPFELVLRVVPAEGGDPVDLARFTPTTRFLTQFLPFFDQYALSHRVWSPAGDALVLPMAADGRSQITVVPIDGSGARVIAEGEMPAWSR